MRVEIMATHPFGFRALNWAALDGIEWANDRPCYRVRFPDGRTDLWPIHDSADPYEFRSAWTCDWQPDDLNPGPDCPYCAGQMCARFDGLGCTHDLIERHGYPLPDGSPSTEPREQQIERIAAVLHVVAPGQMWPVRGVHEVSDETFARSLYDAGLRASTEPPRP